MTEDNTNEPQVLSKIEHDKVRWKKIKEKLRIMGERSTFHGIDILLEASPGWRRRLSGFILTGMCIACIYTVSVLIASFVNKPISTVINYGQAKFQFPVVSICPDSPFSIEKLQHFKELTDKYEMIANYWIRKSPAYSTPNPKRWSPVDGHWRTQAKRTFRNYYMMNRSRMMWKWEDIVVDCEYEGKPCQMENFAIDMPTAFKALKTKDETMPLGSVSVNWPAKGLGPPPTVNPNGPLSPVLASDGKVYLPAGWATLTPDLSNMKLTPPDWPRGQVLIVDHPSKYYCFQLKLKTNKVKEPGSIRGLHVVLRRPYDTAKTQPALLTVESMPSIMQAWDDRRFLGKSKSTNKQRDAKAATAMDGFHVIIHQDSQIDDAGALSSDDIFKASSSRSVFSLPIRFGQQASVGISQFMHQLIMLRRCHCFSEDYMVPLQMADELVQFGFCHADSKAVPSGSIDFMARVNCYNQVSALTREEVLNITTPHGWRRAEHLWLCPKFCAELISQAEVVQRHDIVSDLPKNVTKLSKTVIKSDVVAITIYATEARIPVMSEGEQTNIFNLLASIGGAFGLFLGLSGVTFFEMFESISQMVVHAPLIARVFLRWVKEGLRNAYLTVLKHMGIITQNPDSVSNHN